MKCIKQLMFSVELRRKADEVTQIVSGPLGCNETSVSNYHYTVRNMPEDRRSQVDKITTVTLTLILLTWNIGRAPNNVSKWQMGFNSAFKGLKLHSTKAFPFQKATRQAPYIFMQSVSPPHSSQYR
jgi:hypothetical protein